ncbi:MAG: efflux RND transporter periplasmic adaptor subunit [Calditrichaeota bacterium]|nr:MAG: efflux RND transporter periplasmic adaptor subunit [Calditrichota bacterium]
MKKYILLSLVIVVAVATIAVSKSQPEKKQTQKFKYVTAEEIKTEEIRLIIRTSGVLSARDEVLLSFKTGGIIKKVLVESGAQVKKGQLLAQLDLAEISAQRAQAESGLEKARRDYKRVENLFKENVATLEMKQNAQTAVDVAASNLKIASFNEKHSKIYAPANGKVLHRFAEAGELTSPGRPVLAFGNTGAAFVLKVGLTDRDMIRVQTGDSARVFFDAIPSKHFSATVKNIAAAATPGSGTFEAELQLENNGATLFSGFVGKATIFPKSSGHFKTIPFDAMQEANGKTGAVFVIKKSQIVEKRSIQIAHILDDRVAIFSGLEDATQVVIEGSAYLRDGDNIRIAKKDDKI